jgi:hypothetical protein
MRREREQHSELTRAADQDAADSPLSGARLRSDLTESTRPVRPSVRPSAFGPPRPSQAPAAAAADAEPAPSRPHEAPPFEEAPPEPTPSGTRRRLPREKPLERTEGASLPDKPGEPPQTFRADLEELLPFVGTTSSFPRALSLPALPERPSHHRIQDPRRTRLSLAIFGAMLLASAIPLLRYARMETPVPSETSPAHEASRPAPPAVVIASQPQPAPAKVKPPQETRAPRSLPEAQHEALSVSLETIEASLPAEPSAAADQLLREGLKALAAGDARLAEALLGRALKRDDDNPRAHFALAQIRFDQGNLEGAEGWVSLALSKRPRRAEYHTLYARILEGLGRGAEAAQARTRAAELSARKP